MILKITSENFHKNFYTHISCIGYKKKIVDNSFYFYYINDEYYFYNNTIQINNFHFDFDCYSKEKYALFRYTNCYYYRSDY